jgi:hypothetical protein
MIDTAVLAKVTATKPPLWEKYRRLGGGPLYIRLGGPIRGAIRYRVRDVVDWLKSREVLPAGEGPRTGGGSCAVTRRKPATPKQQAIAKPPECELITENDPVTDGDIPF